MPPTATEIILSDGIFAVSTVNVPLVDKSSVRIALKGIDASVLSLKAASAASLTSLLGCVPSPPSNTPARYGRPAIFISPPTGVPPASGAGSSVSLGCTLPPVTGAGPEPPPPPQAARASADSVHNRPVASDPTLASRRLAASLSPAPPWSCRSAFICPSSNNTARK